MHRPHPRDVIELALFLAVVGVLLGGLLYACKPSTVRDAVNTLDDTCAAWNAVRDGGADAQDN